MTLTYGNTSISLDVVANSVELSLEPVRERVVVTANGDVVGNPPDAYNKLFRCTVRIGSPTTYNEFKSFINTCGIKGYAFTIAADNYIDFGNGLNQAATGRFWEPIELPSKAAGLWYVELTIRIDNNA